MGKQKSFKGKGTYATYLSRNSKEKNARKKLERIEKRLAKRKEWRIRKYKDAPEIRPTTKNLFIKWKIPFTGKVVSLKQIALQES